MNNSDPTGEFMSQMPPAEMGAKMGRKGDAATVGSQLEWVSLLMLLHLPCTLWYCSSDGNSSKERELDPVDIGRAMWSWGFTHNKVEGRMIGQDWVDCLYPSCTL